MARTTEYRTEFTPNEVDFRERIHPKKDFPTEKTGSPQTLLPGLSGSATLPNPEHY